MVPTELRDTLQVKFRALESELDERSRRRWGATEALALGRGGISAVAKATGMSRRTIRVGIRELQDSGKPEVAGPRRIRRAGGGRKRLTEQDATVLRDLEALVEPTARGDPMSALRWTLKSTRELAAALTRQGHRIGRQKVDDLLHALDYSLQGNRKTREGSSHPDRNAQFEYINQRVAAFQRQREPVVSVDTKKKELVGDFKNVGREWRPAGRPEPVRVHDFVDPRLGKVVPYQPVEEVFVSRKSTPGACAKWVEITRVPLFQRAAMGCTT